MTNIDIFCPSKIEGIEAFFSTCFETPCYNLRTNHAVGTFLEMIEDVEPNFIWLFLTFSDSKDVAQRVIEGVKKLYPNIPIAILLLVGDMSNYWTPFVDKVEKTWPGTVIRYLSFKEARPEEYFRGMNIEGPGPYKPFGGNRTKKIIH